MTRIEQLASPARQALSLSARRILDRIEVEIASSAQPDVAISFNAFEDFGVHRHAIAPALRELAGLGFVEINGRPAHYRLSDGWREVTTPAFARSIAVWARLQRCPSWALRFHLIAEMQRQQEQSTQRKRT